MKMRNLTKFCLFSLAFGLASCGGEPKTIKIGVYGPFTGGSAPMGASMRNGVQLAAEEINAAGGINGKKIELVERDDEAKNERGGQVVQELLDKEKCVALLGPINTGVADASTKYAQQKKVPQIINVSAGAKVNDLFKDNPENYIFRIAASDYVQSEMIVREAIDVRKKKKVGILCDDTNYGQGGRDKMEKALATRNIKAATTGKFKVKDTDMTAQLQEAKKAGVEVLLCYGIGPELAAIANSMEKIGWKVPMIGSWTLSMNNFINNATKNGDGATMPQTFIELGATNPKAVKFIDDYHKKFSESPIAVAVAAAQGYDSMNLLKAAIEQAQGTNGAKIKAALEDLQKPFEGVTSTYNKPFSKTDHEAIKEANVTMGVVGGGRVNLPTAAPAAAATPAPATAPAKPAGSK
jgi:branched-chain amino acid transport system substrate-binding protein